MKDFERKGNSVAEIIAAFCREFQVKENQIRYQVVRESSPGFLGFIGKKQALVKIQLPEVEESIREFTQNLLQKMLTGFDSIIVKKDNDNYQVNILGATEPGFLIGKEGRMLDNIQYLLNRIFEKDAGLDHIYLDVDGYKERQEEKLLRRLTPLLERAKEKQQSITLDPMNPSERRIIHKYVEKDAQLRTLTVGDGKMKRIVIFPAKSKNQAAAQNRNNQNGQVPNEQSNHNQNRHPQRRPRANANRSS
jgi:spoIIIJ-associated protein